MNKKALLIIFLAIGLSGCSLLKNSNKNSILGKWKAQSEVINGKVKNVNKEEYIQFLNEGTMIYVEIRSGLERERVKKANYTLKNGKLIIINKKGKEFILDYKINRDTLILTYKDTKQILKRVKD